MDLNTEDGTYITNESVALQNSSELATVSPALHLDATIMVNT